MIPQRAWTEAGPGPSPCRRNKGSCGSSLCPLAPSCNQGGSGKPEMAGCPERPSAPRSSSLGCGCGCAKGRTGGGGPQNELGLGACVCVCVWLSRPQSGGGGTELWVLHLGGHAPCSWGSEVTHPRGLGGPLRLPACAWPCSPCPLGGSGCRNCPLPQALGVTGQLAAHSSRHPGRLHLSRVGWSPL